MSEISVDNILPSRLRSKRVVQPVALSKRLPEWKKSDTPSAVVSINNGKKKILDLVASWNESARVYLQPFLIGSIEKRGVVCLTKVERQNFKEQLSSMLEQAESLKEHSTLLEPCSILANFKNFHTLLQFESRNINKQVNLWRSLSLYDLPEDVKEILELFRVNGELLTNYLDVNRKAFSKSDWVPGRKICRKIRKYMNSKEKDTSNPVAHSIRMNTILLIHYGMREFYTLYKVWRQE